MNVPIEVLFTSSGDSSPRNAIARLLEEAAQEALSGRLVAVNVHLFALTDPYLVSCLRNLADTPGVIIRLLLDWCQGGPGSNRQALALAKHPRVALRFQLDWPYVYEDGQLRWRYSASLGLCHHKSLLVEVDGRATALATGSYNWTARAVRGYENLLVLRPENVALAHLIWRHGEEFRAAWNLQGASVCAATSAALFAKGTNMAGGHTTIRDAILDSSLEVMSPEPLLIGEHAPAEQPSGAPRMEVAFSGAPAAERKHRRGFSTSNHHRAFSLRKPSGLVKRVPLTLEALALEALNRARSGDLLRIAMFAFSCRSVEYATLLNTARRGVNVRLLIDRRASSRLEDALNEVIATERLAIELRVTSRFMHQKYLVLENENLVVNGTANFTPDSSQRHVESRILIEDNSHITECFTEDFDRIWNRVCFTT